LTYWHKRLEIQLIIKIKVIHSSFFLSFLRFSLFFLALVIEFFLKT